MKQHKVIVTGVGGRSVGYGIVQSLLTTDNKYNITGTDCSSFSFGLYKSNSRFVIPKAGKKNYINSLNNIAGSVNAEAIFPGTIKEVEYLSDNQNLINVPLIMNLNKSLIDICRDKFILYEYLKKLGIETPETVLPHQSKKIILKKGFPLIIKPRTDTGASRNVSIVSDMKELNIFKNEYLKNNIDYVLQEVIGTGNDEYTVGVLNDKDGDLIDSIIMHRKLVGLSLKETRIINDKTYNISTGYSQGFIIKDINISSYCEKIANIINNIGPLNLQLRIVNHKIYIFEVHPRFSGTTPIRTSVGFNEPDILFHNYLFLRKYGRINYKYNVAAIRGFEHIIIPIEEMPH